VIDRIRKVVHAVFPEAQVSTEPWEGPVVVPGAQVVVVKLERGGETFYAHTFTGPVAPEWIGRNLVQDMVALLFKWAGAGS
jgi:hypothetical protein